MMFRPRKLQIGGEYEEDNKFNPTPINLRPQPSYGFVGPMQPTTPNYGPMGPFNYDNSPGLKDDCPEGMTWSEEDQRCVYPNGYDPTQEQEKNKPKGRGIDGMGTPKTGPGTGVNPQDPVKKQQSKIDPYFALRGATTGLSWLSEMVDRNRQNQYATDQYSTLGQIDPMPVSNFQPNRYNLYAQKGGNLPQGKLLPNVTVSNKPTYEDSMKLYKLNPIIAQELLKTREASAAASATQGYNRNSYTNPNYQKDRDNEVKLMEANIKQVEKLGQLLTKYGINGFNYTNKIKPSVPNPNYKYNGTNPAQAMEFLYPKPIGTPKEHEPQLKKSFRDYPLIDQESNELNIIPSNNPGQIAGDIPVLPYRVEYDGINHQDFPDEKSGTEFQNELRNRPQGIPYGTTGRYRNKYQGGGRTPIYVNNPNDPRLRAYNDSSEARRITENTLLAAKWNKIDKLPVNVMTQDEYHKINPVADLSEANYKNIAAKIGVRQHKWGTQGFPIFPTPVQPVVYKKPVQPYIYKDEPQLKKSFNNYPLIDQESNELNIIPSNNPGQIAGDIKPLPYRVEYDGTEHQNFLTEKEGTEFQNSLRNRPQGIPYGTRGYYEKKQKGGKLAPITVDTPNDPRLKAYNDSLNLYKASEENRQWLLSNPNIKKPIYNSAYPALSINGKIQPTGSYEGDVVNTVGVNVNKYAFNKYKKPVQPVVYKKPEVNNVKTLPNINIQNNKYSDSLTLYRTKTSLPVSSNDPYIQREINDIIKNNRLYGSDLFDNPKNRAAAKRISPTGDEYDVKPIWTKVGDRYIQTFKKPIGVQEQKDYPIVTRPKAQVKGKITPAQPTRDTSQDGTPIYGPANSTIGYWNNGEFSPYTGVNQRGTVNNPDTELMQNPEALKKYLRGKGLNFKKGGLTPNKARQILHDGTAQGHPLTDKQRRFFGAKSKGHTNFRK